MGDGAELLPGQKGAARIALMAGAPVVSVGLWGTQHRWPKSGLTFSPPARPTVAVVYGEPIHSEADPKRRSDVQALTDRIMDDIAGLVAQARRGSEPAPHSSRRRSRGTVHLVVRLGRTRATHHEHVAGRWLAHALQGETAVVGPGLSGHWTSRAFSCPSTLGVSIWRWSQSLPTS